MPPSMSDIIISAVLRESTSGSISCWGEGSSGQLGDGRSADSLSPVSVSGAYRSVAAGGDHTCAVTSTNELLCWGSDSSGQQGNGAGVANQPSPMRTSDADIYQTVTAGGAHSCARAKTSEKAENRSPGIPTAVARSPRYNDAP